MSAEIREHDFDPWRCLAEYQARRGLGCGRSGATAAFVGTMREFNEGDDVKALTLEHYPGMTERELKRIVDDASAQWSLDDALVIHRVGRMAPGDPIVLVAVWSAHRKAAFDACRHIMEVLKSRAPFWKHEELGNTQRWVEKNTPG
jgi:molybdopterin synthase catalytic subunit